MASWVSRLFEKCASARRRRSRAGIHSPSKPFPPENLSCRRYALFVAYLMMGVTGLGYLALTWSTVVLLGGFVTVLGKKDFWCLTAISMLQAARIFNDMEDRLFINFAQVYLNMHRNDQICTSLEAIVKLVTTGSVLIFGLFYRYGSVICLALSSWRLLQRDYGSTYGDSNKANLVPALDLFYSMVLCQSVLLYIWFCFNHEQKFLTNQLCQLCKFPEKWGKTSIQGFISDMRAKCWQNPASIRGRKVIHYAVEMLDSEPQKDYLTGARMIDAFIKLEADARSLLLTSRPRIQKLIDTLRWRTADREIKELAARIVAHLAYDIDLTQFPGAIRCISSLLDTTPSNWNNQQADSPIDGSNGEGWNEMILQGLTIIERLASDQHNCRDICSTPGLLSKIMSPLYSHTLIQDINVSAWAEVVKGSLKVVHSLIRAPEWTGRRLAYEISSSKQAVSNLERILDQGTRASQELQMRAIEILTELALDSSTNLTEETLGKLIRKQLQLFLDEGGEEMLKVTAGRTLALLSKIGAISLFIKTEHNDIIDLLSQKINFRNRNPYGTIAAKILENFCSHHHNTMDKEHVKITLLPMVMVLGLVLTSGRKPPVEASQINVAAPGENQELQAPGNDEENQLPRHNSQNNSFDQNEEQTATTELQEALLSLTLVICDKLISADDFDDVAGNIVIGEGEFVAKLKAIVEENCEGEATAGCLRVVKLCSQIAVLMMRCSQDIAHFKDQKFVESLSTALKIMCNLESRMRFTGTDEVKKTVRPLLSDLVEEAYTLVG